MSQVALGIIDGKIEELTLPGAHDELMRDVVWGRFDELFTPAYWAVQAWLDKETKRYSRFRLGDTLLEEVVACLLGGHGIPSEVGNSAYSLIRGKGLLTGERVRFEEIATALREPLTLDGRVVHYRFWKQKARYLSSAIEILSNGHPPINQHKTFRNWLVNNLPGVGPKTASWITRNWLSSDDVAIIDIHIHRAGLMAGFIDKSFSVDRHYREMEEGFLSFANAIGVKASILDNLIWRQMKELNSGRKDQTQREATLKRNVKPVFRSKLKQQNLFL